MNVTRSALASAAALMLLVPFSARAGNLLRNPGAEELPADQLPGWTTTADFRAYGNTPPTPFGAYCFFGGGGGTGDVSTASQTVSVATVAQAIDAGRRKATLSAQLAGYKDQNDSATVTAEFLDGTGGVLGQTQLGPVTGAAWQFRSVTVPVPALTRAVRVRMIATRVDGSDIDGYFDDLWLSVDATAGKLYTVPPCRVIDTRDSSALAAGETRTVAVGGHCGVPSDAIAAAVNVTVVAPAASGSMTLFPASDAAPLASSINFSPALTRANNGIVGLSGDGTAAVRVRNGSGGTAHVILDVSGYFR